MYSIAYNLRPHFTRQVIHPFQIKMVLRHKNIKYLYKTNTITLTIIPIINRAKVPANLTIMSEITIVDYTILIEVRQCRRDYSRCLILAFEGVRLVFEHITLCMVTE